MILALMVSSAGRGLFRKGVVRFFTLETTRTTETMRTITWTFENNPHLKYYNQFQYFEETTRTTEATQTTKSGEIQKGTGGRGQDRKCHKLSQIVMTFYDEFYDD